MREITKNDKTRAEDEEEEEELLSAGDRAKK